MKKELTIGLLTVALTVGLASMASAQEDIEDQETDVDVTVDSVTQLDVRPSALSYESVAPGSQVTSSENGYEHVDIENIGSTRIREITSQATMPLDQPFGQFDDTDYNTGNFIQLSLDTAQDTDVSSQITGAVSQDGDPDTSDDEEQVPHYVNRVEFFEENPPEYITVDEDVSENHEIGRFREGDVEYFFQLSHDGAGDSQDSDMNLRVGRAPHTSTQLGTVDFEDGDFVEFDGDADFEASSGASDNYMILESSSLELVAFDTENSDYGADTNLLNEDGEAEFNTEDLEDHSVRDYDLYIHPEDADDEPHILRTRFNTQPVSPSELDDGSGNDLETLETENAQDWIFDASSAENQLQPGQNFPINIGVELPQGVDQNAIQNGAVTFFASEGEEEEE